MELFGGSAVLAVEVDGVLSAWASHETLWRHGIGLSFEPIRRHVGEGATLLIAFFDERLVGRPGNGDCDPLGLAAGKHE